MSGSAHEQHDSLLLGASVGAKQGRRRWPATRFVNILVAVLVLEVLREAFGTRIVQSLSGSSGFRRAGGTAAARNLPRSLLAEAEQAEVAALPAVHSQPGSQPSRQPWSGWSIVLPLTTGLRRQRVVQAAKAVSDVLDTQQVDASAAAYWQQEGERGVESQEDSELVTGLRGWRQIPE
ncbi:hypothetical protein N2152v2_001315 [Parachlorella kessleri]